MLHDLSYVPVELVTIILSLTLLVMGLLVPKTQNKGLSNFATLVLVGILLLTLVNDGQSHVLFGGTYLVDPFSTFFKQLFIIAAILVAMLAKDFVQNLSYSHGEFYALLTAALLGMMIMASAGDLITLYIGLELMTITFCILVAYKKRDAKSSEAGIKYIVLGALSSSILLYGLSLVYGLTQTTFIAEIGTVLNAGQITPLLILGMVFLLAGFAFKISAVPFHMWSPDIYEGAPTPITAFLAVGSKAAGFAALLRILMIALPSIADFWLLIAIVLSILTMVLGNLVAIPQTNIKRMLAYSSIAQAGYLLLGLIAYTSLGVAAILFHSLLYVFANIGAFAVAVSFSKATGSDEIKDYAGLAQRSPILAAVMLISLLSLAGIPPLAGFVSKFYLFTAIIDRGYIWLAFIAIGMTMVSVYYYLVVAKAMYLGQPKENAEPIRISGSTQLVLTITMIVTVFFGIYPTPLTNVALAVAKTFFPF